MKSEYVHFKGQNGSCAFIRAKEMLPVVFTIQCNALESSRENASQIGEEGSVKSHIGFDRFVI
jgi:hypothetical protein